MSITHFNLDRKSLFDFRSLSRASCNCLANLDASRSEQSITEPVALGILGSDQSVLIGLDSFHVDGLVQLGVEFCAYARHHFDPNVQQRFFKAACGTDNAIAQMVERGVLFTGRDCPIEVVQNRKQRLKEVELSLF